MKVVEKTKTHILLSVTFFVNRNIFETVWKNTVQPDGPQMTIKYGAFALHAG